MKDGILYHYPSKGKSALKEVVKDEDVGGILKAFHGDKAGGCHFGVTTTFTKLSCRNASGGKACMTTFSRSHDLISHKYKVSQIPHNAVFCMLLTHYVIYNVHTRRNTVLQGGKITIIYSRFPPGAIYYNSVHSKMTPRAFYYGGKNTTSHRPMAKRSRNRRFWPSRSAKTTPKSGSICISAGEPHTFYTSLSYILGYCAYLNSG